LPRPLTRRQPFVIIDRTITDMNAAALSAAVDMSCGRISARNFSTINRHDRADQTTLVRFPAFTPFRNDCEILLSS